MDGREACMLKLVDFKGVFEGSLQRLEALKPGFNIFEGIYPSLDVCKQNNDDNNNIQNIINITNKLGYSEFDRFLNSFRNRNEALSFFDGTPPLPPSASSLRPASSPLSPSFPLPTSQSLTQNPSTNVKEQTCLQYYNYCLVNANWTLINQQPCITSNNNTNNTFIDGNNRGILNKDNQTALISSLNFCPKPLPHSSTVFREKNTKKNNHITVTATYFSSDIKTKNLKTNDSNNVNTRFNDKTTFKNTELHPNNKTTTRMAFRPVNNVTYKEIRGDSNNSSLACLILIPIIVVIIALVLLWRKKKKASLIKQKRMMVQRTESSTTATTIMTSYPQTPTSTTDLISFHVDKKKKENSKNNKVKTMRQDSDYSNYTSSGDSINIPKQLDVKELEESHELAQSTPTISDKNINAPFSSVESPKSHLNSTNPLHKETKASGGVSIVVESLTNEWDKRFNSIIDWMNRSEMGLSQSET